MGAIEDRPLAEFRRVMETNYFGALRCIQAVLPPMRVQREGSIINVSSIAGRVVDGAMGAYAASKFALEALSEALAQEVKAFNIRVAIVEPGTVETPIFDKMCPPPEDSCYPQERRLRALFAALRRHPTSADVVGEQIREIIEHPRAQLRYPVGPDAEPFLDWRARMSDEAWIDYNATHDDEAWYQRLARDFGLDARPQP